MTLYIGRWKLEAHGQSAAYLWSQNVQTGSGEICWWDDTKIFKNSLITFNSCIGPYRTSHSWLKKRRLSQNLFNASGSGFPQNTIEFLPTDSTDSRVASWKGTKDHNGSQWIITMILYDIIWYDSIWHVYDTLWYYIYTKNTFKKIQII